MRDLIVIGAGVSGLTCAIELLEAGFDVTIITKETHPNITSSVAAALWFPYEAFPVDRVEAWAALSYSTYHQLAREKGTGIRMIESLQLSDRSFDRPGWVRSVAGYRDVTGPDLPDGYIDGYSVTIPVIETPVFMPYLMDRFVSQGGKVRVVPNGINSFEEVDAATIVNCSGLGAADLCNDGQVFPIKGQVIRVVNPGIVNAICDDDSVNAIGYVIPRTDDVILGGISVKGDWSLEPSKEVTDEILRKCSVLEPRIASQEILEVRCGSRPGRSEVRLETEMLPTGQLVVHNYGHGGAGFTLAWGCAREVASLIPQSPLEA